jgi:hypothetical protein
MLLLAGAHPRVVQERLGHSQVGITLQTYSHVLLDLQGEAARKVGELLGKGPLKDRQQKAALRSFKACLLAICWGNWDEAAQYVGVQGPKGLISCY